MPKGVQNVSLGKLCTAGPALRFCIVSNDDPHKEATAANARIEAGVNLIATRNTYIARGLGVDKVPKLDTGGFQTDASR